MERLYWYSYFILSYVLNIIYLYLFLYLYWVVTNSKLFTILLRKLLKIFDKWHISFLFSFSIYILYTIIQYLLFVEHILKFCKSVKPFDIKFWCNQHKQKYQINLFFIKEYIKTFSTKICRIYLLSSYTLVH